MSGLKRKRPDDEFASSNSTMVKNHVSDKDMDKKSEVRMESVYQKTLLKLRNGARNASNNNMGASGDSQAQPGMNQTLKIGSLCTYTRHTRLYFISNFFSASLKLLKVCLN